LSDEERDIVQKAHAEVLPLRPLRCTFAIFAVKTLDRKIRQDSQSGKESNAGGQFMVRSAAIALTFSSLMTVLSLPVLSQTSGELQDYFKNSIGLGQEQIADIRGGKSVAKVMKSRTADEIFVWGAVYVKAVPESYIQFAGDFDRLAKLPEFLAVRKFSNPPQVTDLEGFTFDADDIKALRECKPGHCEVQLPAQAIEHLQQSID
jgi:hypothetical protein